MNLHEKLAEIERETRRFEVQVAETHGRDFAMPEPPSAAEGRPDDLLVIGLVGGTGVGKSSIVNALARTNISRTAKRRPTTDRVVAWAHEDRAAALEAIPAIRGHLSEQRGRHRIPALRSIAILDLPDVDSLEASHSEVVRAVLPVLDLVIWVTSVTKYADRVFGEWVAANSRALDPANLVFVLNKIDEIDEADGSDALTRLEASFRERLGTILDGGDSEDPLRVYLVSAAPGGVEGAPDAAFEEFRAWILRERDEREMRRIKASNRTVDCRRRIENLRRVLAIEERRRLIDDELAALRHEVGELLGRETVRAEMAAVLSRGRALDSLTDRLLAADLAAWPLLPRLGPLTAPLRRLIRSLTRLPSLLPRDESDREAAAMPMATLRSGIEKLFRERRRRESLRNEPLLAEPSPPPDPAAIGQWVTSMEAEVAARLIEEAQAAVDRPQEVGAATRRLRQLLVWGAIIWFPLVQPLAQDLLDPRGGLAAAPLRVTYRIVRIMGASHILVSALVLIGYFSVLMSIRRALALRAARARLDRSIASPQWRASLQERLLDLVAEDLARSAATLAREDGRSREILDGLREIEGLLS